jgi:hypothetical protein
MSSEVSLTKRDRALLIGDGFALTATTFAASIAVGLGLWVLLGSPGSSAFFALTNVVLMFAGGAGGIVATWLLHGRRITAAAVIGAIAGAAAGGLAVPLVAALSYLVGLPLSLMTTWEFAGPVATLGIVSLAFVALFVWLVVDAVRDLGPARREHVRLDIARIVAAVLFAIYVGVVLVQAFAQPGAEMGEAIIFALAAGPSGAMAVAGADFATGLARRPDPPPAAEPGGPTSTA